MRHFDYQDRSEGLHTELRNRRDGADKGILVFSQVSVCLKSKDSSIAEGRLVENLKQVYPY